MVAKMQKVLQINLTPIFSPSRVFIGCSLLIRDRTAEEELVKARDAAEAATRAKSQFLANMSHELRTPLNAVIGITEMLMEDADNLGHDDFVEPLQRIQRAGNHLLDLINEILDLSKIESGMLKLNYEVFDMTLLLHDAIGTSAPLAAKNNNWIKLVCPQKLGDIYSDPTRIRQIVLNLLSNACKFTENGRITVEATREDKDAQAWLTLKVSDTGIGMLPEQVKRIFEQFTQADNTTTRKYGGTGLGLAISQRLCQMMRGTIDVNSKPGLGTTFRVRLPINTHEPPSTLSR